MAKGNQGGHCSLVGNDTKVPGDDFCCALPITLFHVRNLPKPTFSPRGSDGANPPSTLGKGTGPNAPGHSDWVKDKQMTFPTNESFGKDSLSLGAAEYRPWWLSSPSLGENTLGETGGKETQREKKKNKEHRHRDKDRETPSLVTWLQHLNSEKHSSGFSIT